MTTILILFALNLAAPNKTHAGEVSRFEDLERLEQVVSTRKIDVRAWTPRRERWAAQRLAGRAESEVAGQAWDRLSAEEQRELAVREAIDDEVDRELASLRYFRTRALRPPTKTDEWAVSYLIELFGAKASKLGRDIEAEFGRVRGRFNDLAGHVITLKSSNGSVRSSVREPWALDEIIEIQGEVFGRLLVRAVEARDAGLKDLNAREVESALHVLARAYLLMGANSGSYNVLRSATDWRSVLKNVGNGVAASGDRFTTLVNLRDSFWKKALPHYLASIPDYIGEAQDIRETTSARHISIRITNYLMGLSPKTQYDQCERMFESLESQTVATAEAMRGEAHRAK